MRFESEIWDGKLCKYWFGPDSILYGISIEHPRTMEALKEDFSLVRNITGNNKTCLILDNTNIKAHDMKALKYLLKELPRIYKAVAFVPRSPIGTMVSNITVHLKPSDSIPMKVFQKETQARKWIAQYL